jgi:hypothetical protein
MTHYPLLFLFKDRLTVRDDLVEVTGRGRVLAVQEPEGWWLYGVTPGDLAESGGTSAEAVAAFRKTFSEVLQDIAASVVNFHEFEVEVRDFFTSNQAREHDWLAAVQAVRQGQVVLNDLPRLAADTPVSVEVRVIGRAANRLTLDETPMALAA